MMSYKFFKMNGTGNDFVVIDNRESIITNPVEFTKAVCRRRVAVGADGVLLLENSNSADIRMRYLNADGSEVEMCGNGARCTAFFANYLGFEKELTMQTEVGVLSAKILSSDNTNRFPFDGVVRLQMPRAIIHKEPIKHHIDGKEYLLYRANTGVPHIVIFVDDIDNTPVVELGRKIRYDKKFNPPGTNVNFVQIIDEHNIAVRTYERGVEDETLSCGTGVCAAALISGIIGKTKSSVTAKVRLPAELTIEFDDFNNIFLIGKVTIAFKGEVDYS